MNFYKHHLGDYDGATSHLSWDEDMAYTRLLRAYYRREAPIPDADRYRLIRALTKAQKEATDRVLAEFFILEADGWHQKRCDEELASYRALVEHNKAVGLLGGRPKKTPTVTGNNPSGNQSGSKWKPGNNPSQNQNQNQNQIPEKTHTPAAAATPPPEKQGRVRASFFKFWEVYPKKTAKQDALKAWQEIDPDDALLETMLNALEAQAKTPQWQQRGAIPHPHNWLTGRRWEDEIPKNGNGTTAELGQCSWNVNGNREGEPRCDCPATTLKNGVPYCPSHSQRVNAWG